MARQSVDRRMDRIIDRLLPPGSVERREYELPEHLKALLLSHRQRTAAIITRYEKIAPGDAYRRFIRNEITFPAMPAVLRDALGLLDPPTCVDPDDIAKAWDRYRDGEQQ